MGSSRARSLAIGGLIAALAACNALTGVGDLEPTCPNNCLAPTLDAATDGAAGDAGRDARAPLADAGASGAAFDAADGAMPVVLPVSCKALHASTPSAKDGNHPIDPDGTGPEAPLVVHCDMTTNGGGWTVVFVPTTTNYATPAPDYTSATPTLLTNATEALLAYRDANLGVLGSQASFALPDAWKTQAPFRYAGTDVAITPTVDGMPSASSRTLRYGNQTFASLCDDAWDVTAQYGRICIAGTTAPFYSGFAIGSADNCVGSNEVWSILQCSAAKQFTIAVR